MVYSQTFAASALQDKLGEEAMGGECRDKVIADTERSSTDYRCAMQQAESSVSLLLSAVLH